MHKRTMYWLVGIVAAALLLWFATRGGGNDLAGDMPQGTQGVAEQEAHHPQAGTTEDHVRVYAGEQDAVMAEMMRAMEAVEPSGNVALDFLDGMIPHHAAAIAMAESYLGHGGADETLRQIARDVAVTQRQEIDEMRSMAQTLREKGEKNAQREEAYLKAYRAMLTQHHASHSVPTANVDETFAEGMILHHQMAVDMSKAALQYAQEEDVRALAQRIVEAQEQEIAQMQEVLKRLQQG